MGTLVVWRVWVSTLVMGEGMPWEADESGPLVASAIWPWKAEERWRGGEGEKGERMEGGERELPELPSCRSERRSRGEIGRSNGVYHSAVTTRPP